MLLIEFHEAEWMMVEKNSLVAAAAAIFARNVSGEFLGEDNCGQMDAEMSIAGNLSRFC